MIVQSKITKENYFWVRIPRTGTHSYTNIFFPGLNNDEHMLKHEHVSINASPDTTGCMNPVKFRGGFTVVRDPKTRFISGLRHFLNAPEYKVFQPTNKRKVIRICPFCGKIAEEPPKTTLESFHGAEFFKNEDVFYDFCYSNFEKNGFLKTTSSLLKDEEVPSMMVFFKTQVEFCYNPKMKFFRYENIQEFNNWIETTLGYSTRHLTRMNTSQDSTLNIDTTTKKFDELVKYLFHDDYKVFGY